MLLSIVEDRNLNLMLLCLIFIKGEMPWPKNRRNSLPYTWGFPDKCRVIKELVDLKKSPTCMIGTEIHHPVV